MGIKIAMRLLVPFLGKGYCVRIDNYYTLQELVDKLLQHKTDVCDTVWPTRKDMPPSKTWNWKGGYPKISARKVHGPAIAWQKTRHLAEHSPRCDSCRKTLKTKKWWNQLNSMTTKMTWEVSISEQNLSFHPIIKGVGSVYYKKIWHLFDMCLHLFHSVEKIRRRSRLHYCLGLVERVILAANHENEWTKFGRRWGKRLFKTRTMSVPKAWTDVLEPSTLYSQT